MGATLPASMRLLASLCGPVFAFICAIWGRAATGGGT